MRVKPRHVEEIIAIRLADDLIAEHGNVLIIRDEAVEIMSEDEFEKEFEVNSEHEDGGNAPSVAASTVRRSPAAAPAKPPLTRNRLNSEERIILAFGPDTEGSYLTGLSVGKLSQILERMPTITLLDRLFKLTKNKHIVGHIEDGLLVYSLTDMGKEVSIGLREKRRKH